MRIPDAVSGDASVRPPSPESATVQVSTRTLERLLALYAAGYSPHTRILHLQAAALGWSDCEALDATIGWYPWVQIETLDGSTISALALLDTIDFGSPGRTSVGNIVLMPRQPFLFGGERI